MNLAELKKITKGDPDKFLNIEGGYVNWTFKQVVLYQGFEGALKIVKQYRGHSENYKLRRDYKRIVQEGDCWLFEISTKQEDLELLVDFDGFIISGDLAGLAYKEYVEENRSKFIKIIYNKAWKKDHNGST